MQEYLSQTKSIGNWTSKTRNTCFHGWLHNFTLQLDLIVTCKIVLDFMMLETLQMSLMIDLINCVFIILNSYFMQLFLQSMTLWIASLECNFHFFCKGLFHFDSKRIFSFYECVRVTIFREFVIIRSLLFFVKLNNWTKQRRMFFHWIIFVLPRKKVHDHE